MVERKVDWAAAAMGARRIAGDGERLFRGAAIDSRRVQGGEIFFALPGERVDGHEFAAEAVRRGAAAVVVHRDLEPGGEAAWLRVDDTFAALHALTRAVRAEVPEHLLALTGSVGKTTTKEVLGAILARRFRTARSPGNLNNLYGFPLSLLNIPDGSEWMVAEMGMSVPGELGAVSRLGRPDVALLLCVRPVHLASFADLRAIAEAKAEILEGLRPDGLLVANADDPEVERVARRWQAAQPRGRLVRFGFRAADAEVRGGEVEALGEGRTGFRFEVAHGGERRRLEVPIHGLYNAENVLAATATALAVGLDLDEVGAALHDLRPVAGRGEVIRFERLGVTLVDDTYNSNPEAAVRALESARALAGRRHVAVLGDMLELGPEAPAFHRRVGSHAAGLGFGLVVGVGELARHLVAAAARGGAVVAHFANAAQAAVGTPCVIRPGDVVLVKGSRGVALEAVTAALRAGLVPRQEAA